jgi:hypothetical protein
MDYASPGQNTSIQPNLNEVEAAQKRVVFIKGLKAGVPLKDITKYIAGKEQEIHSKHLIAQDNSR